VRRPSLLSATASILVRLPLGFLLPFILFAGGWTFYLFKEVKKLAQNFPASPLDSIPVLSRLDDILVAIFLVALYLAGLLLAYNLAVLTNWLLVRYGLKAEPAAAVRPHPPPKGGTNYGGFKDVRKIGIVLAGGGAKGAFQAGAMKAIYRFLAEGEALHKVKVISATSIGSWNALFWLADLIQSEKGWGERSAHEAWWRSISLRSLVAPSWYVPCLRNAFFVTAPWQRQFDDIFGQAGVRGKIAHSDIHFYLTSSHVRSGRLECTTNNTEARDLPRVKFTRLDPATGDDAVLQGVKLGVFASMDLPPLFPYMELGDDVFEDGGVIDNLPVMFAAMESCDLIFVLPLNSDFNAEPDHRSLLNRFLRVMDVRQGALERGSLKSQYLYNELAVLRKYARALEGSLREAGVELPAIEMSETLRYALDRTHDEARLFAICPQRTFVESTIDTQELWKSKQAGRAFSAMYRESMFVLQNHFDPKRERITVALVDDGGDPRWARDF
jgi:NTE family protein